MPTLGAGTLGSGPASAGSNGTFTSAPSVSSGWAVYL